MPAQKRFFIVIPLKLCSNILVRLIVAVAIISTFLVPCGYCQETEDSQIFISGFNAYQQKNYPVSIEKMSEVLARYPDTPLRDMALFWLSRAYFKNGNQQEAARYLSQFSKEYPDNPLKNTVDEELLALTARYDKGEKLPTGVLPGMSVGQQASSRKTPVVQESPPRQGELLNQEADQKRLAQEKQERERQAAVKAEEQRVTETARLAEQKTEQERRAAVNAEARRTVDAEAARVAATQKEQERRAAVRTEELRATEATRRAELKAEQDRTAAEQARAAARKTEQERATTAEAARLLAAQKEQEQRAAEAARLAQIKAGQERTAAEQRRVAAQKAEQERTAVEQAAKLRAEQEKRTSALEKEQARLASVKAEEARAAEAARLAELKAEQDRRTAEQSRVAARKAEQERLAAEQAAIRRAEQEKAEKDRIAALEGERARLAQARTEEERQAQEWAAAEKRAAEEAERQKQIRLKAGQEWSTAERVERDLSDSTATESARIADANRERMRLAAESRAAEQRPVPRREGQDRNRAAKAALREKAIAQYKSIIEKYPKSASAAAAAAKLKELGVSVAMPQQTASSEPIVENAKVLNLEVVQFAGVELNLLDAPQAYPVARPITLPFEIVNRGNGDDSFYIESGFPPEFATTFETASAPNIPINQTPSIPPGGSFRGIIRLLIPAASVDGLRIIHPVKVASRFLPDATQSGEVVLTASAPLIRAVIKSDKNQPMPGERLTYRVAVLNVGSAAAQDVSFRLNFPPQLEPVDYARSGFRQEMKAALVIDGLQFKSGESREFVLAFQLKEDSMAGQELLARAELINNQLKTNAAFVSSASYVQQHHGIHVRSMAERLVVIPGQTLNVPFIVTNTGNGREKLKIASSMKGAQDAVIFHDLNRDGIRQASEPLITEVGPLAPKEEISIVMEIKTPRAAADGSEGFARISFSPEGDPARTFVGSTMLVYSRPVLDMAMSGGGSRLKPGEVASFDLTITNRGTNLARVVELQSAWPDKLELVAADPGSSSFANGTILWKFKELGAGERRTIKVSFRVKPGTSMGTNIQVKNILSYEDQLGSRY